MSTEETKNKDIWDKISAVTPLLIGIIITGLGGFLTQIYNFRQLQLSEIASLDKFRPFLLSDKPQDRAFAYSAFVALGQEKLAIKLISFAQDQSGRKALEVIKRQDSSINSENAEKVLKSLNTANILTDKQIFLHINKDEQRLPAEKVKQALKDIGCKVPGIQNIGGKGYVPDQTEIRYFRYPEDRDIAKTILDHLSKKTGLKNARISYVDTDPSATKNGQIEIWFAKSYQ